MKKTAKSAPGDHPPATLSPDACNLWRRYLAEYTIEDLHGRFLLELALLAFDRYRAAQALILAHGEIVADRFGGLRPNPALKIERDARAGMLSALKALNLDIEPPKEPWRPPGGRGR